MVLTEINASAVPQQLQANFSTMEAKYPGWKLDPVFLNIDREHEIREYDERGESRCNRLDIIPLS